MKLRAMVAQPPDQPACHGKQITICWPKSLLFDRERHFVGFLMPRIDLTKHREIFKIATPSARRTEAPGFTWTYLVAAAENIASVVDLVHASGYVIGDINESNFFISATARAAIVDCDSMQVSAPSGLYRCTVAKPEFLAPELYRADLAACIRTKAQDNFALAVLIFQLLMEGLHPYAGKWQGSGDAPPLDERIALGYTPYLGSPRILPSPLALPWDVLPAHLRQLFLRAFEHGVHGPAQRPSASAWRQSLRTLRSSISVCSLHTRHQYSSHLAHCPWCARTAQWKFDTYALAHVASGQQSPPRRATKESHTQRTLRTLNPTPRLNSLLQLFLNKRFLNRMVLATPVLSAAIAALIFNYGGNRFIEVPRFAVVLTASLWLIRAVQDRCIRKAMYILLGTAIFFAVPRGITFQNSSFAAVFGATLAFFASRFVLKMIRSLLEKFRAAASTTAIALALAASLLLSPLIDLVAVGLSQKTYVTDTQLLQRGSFQQRTTAPPIAGGVRRHHNQVTSATRTGTPPNR